VRNDSLPPRWTQQEWMEQALCHGRTGMFFAPHAERPQARVRREAKARQVCQACPVIFECRRYARVHLEYGFWGGESEEERASAGFSVPAPVGGRARRADHTAAG
jgi:WhiB family transcriptional regulator, redox-sensing transcriptional regulator